MQKTRTKKLKKGEIIPLTFDYVFTSIFNNKKNIDILENFIAMYLEIPIKEIKGKLELQQRELELESKEVKNKQIDLLVDYKGEKINIELSNSTSQGIIDRNVTYACNVHGRQLKYGDNSYKRIKRTIQINLNNKHINEEVKETYYLMNGKGKILTKKLQIDIIDMVIGRKICYTNDETKLARWCRVLTSTTEEEFRKSLGDDLMEKESKDKLIDEVKKYSEDNVAVVLYSAYTKEELERNTLREEAEEKGLKEGMARGMQQGMQQGIEQGIEQGIKTNKIETAKKLFEKEFTIDEISEITSLSIEEIKSIL